MTGTCKLRSATAQNKHACHMHSQPHPHHFCPANVPLEWHYSDLTSSTQACQQLARSFIFGIILFDISEKTDCSDFWDGERRGGTFFSISRSMPTANAEDPWRDVAALYVGAELYIGHAANLLFFHNVVLMRHLCGGVINQSPLPGRVSVQYPAVLAAPTPHFLLEEQKRPNSILSRGQAASAPKACALPQPFDRSRGSRA